MNSLEPTAMGLNAGKFQWWQSKLSNENFANENIAVIFVMFPSS